MSPRFTPTLFLYDNYPGGIGISAPLFEHQAAIVAGARQLVTDCECAHGCQSRVSHQAHYTLGIWFRYLPLDCG